MDPVLFLRASFLLVTAALLALLSFPSLTRFMVYGSRATGASESAQAPSILDKLAAISVPHSWFASFYAFSLISSAFWMLQILSRGRVFESLAIRATAAAEGDGMGIQQILLVWGLMVLQGGRRLWECLFIMKRGGPSRMHVAHWALGHWFYLSIGVAVWIEGAPALLQRGGFRWMDLHFTAPTLHSFVSVLLYLVAAGVQHDCHAYLSSLKTYAVPDHPAFHQLICPHYFAECLIYLALAIGAAPAGHILNRTFVCALVFVVANLGATANKSKQWYETKFGVQSVQGRRRMIPFIY